MPTALGTIASAKINTSAGPIPTTGLVGWWDADDASTFTYSSGTVVSQWRDKSGGGHHFDQATVGNQPSRNGTQNGRTTVTFAAATNQNMMSATPATTAVDNITMFMAGKVAAPGGYAQMFHNGRDTGDGYGFTVSSAGNAVAGILIGATAWLTSTTPTPATMYTATIQRTAGTWSLYVNGTLTDLTSTTNPPTPIGTSLTVSGNASVTGAFGEAIIYNRVLTTPERQQVESYLAAKWITPAAPIPTTGLVGWYDANDASTFTYSSGTLVSQWRDKSGVGPHMNHSGAEQPTRNGTQNGHPTVVFGGTANGWLRGQSNCWTTAVDNMTLIVALKETGGAAQYRTAWRNGTAFGYCLMTKNDVGNIAVSLSNVAWVSTATPSVTGAPVVYVTQRTAGTWTIHRDGANIPITAGATTSPAAPNNNETWFSTEYPFAGEMYEFIVYDKALSTVERQQVEAYLAAKWIGIAFKLSLGQAVDTVSGSTLVITTTNPIAVGDLVVVRVAADNLSDTTPTFTAADSGGNSYTVHDQRAGNVTAAAGIAGALMATKATTAIATGGTITVTLSGAVAARAAYAESFTGTTNTTRSTPVGMTSGSGVMGPLITGTVNAGDLVLGWGAIESNAVPISTDTDTLGGAWSTLVTLNNAAGGTASTRVQVGGQWKIPTVAGAQNWGSGGASVDAVSGVVVLAAG